MGGMVLGMYREWWWSGRGENGESKMMGEKEGRIG